MTEMRQWKNFSPFPIVWSPAVWAHVCLMVIATFCLAPAALIFQMKRCSKYYLIVQVNLDDKSFLLKKMDVKLITKNKENLVFYVLHMHK